MNYREVVIMVAREKCNNRQLFKQPRMMNIAGHQQYGAELYLGHLSAKAALFG